MDIVVLSMPISWVERIEDDCPPRRQKTRVLIEVGGRSVDLSRLRALP